jgi:hypothetical protein
MVRVSRSLVEIRRVSSCIHLHIIHVGVWSKVLVLSMSSGNGLLRVSAVPTGEDTVDTQALIDAVSVKS